MEDTHQEQMELLFGTLLRCLVIRGVLSSDDSAAILDRQLVGTPISWDDAMIERIRDIAFPEN